MVSLYSQIILFLSSCCELEISEEHPHPFASVSPLSAVNLINGIQFRLHILNGWVTHSLSLSQTQTHARAHARRARGMGTCS